MRPRELPAEDVADGPSVSGLETAASMRPRELPAEDTLILRMPCGASWSFNEAAGVTRGRRERDGELRQVRPGFNEAAGVTRGRLLTVGRWQAQATQLQ